MSRAGTSITSPWALLPGVEGDRVPDFLDLRADEVPDIEVLAHVALVSGRAAAELVVAEEDRR
jgi:hypothetical protein